MPDLVLEPSPGEFARVRGHANVVPISCEMLADLETPISAYMKLRDLPSSFLLESVEGSAQVARFSVLGGDPRLVLESDGVRVHVTDATGTRAEPGSPLAVVRDYLARYRAETRPELPPFTGGFLVYLGYDAVRCWERLPGRPPDDLGLPIFRLALMDTVVVFDHLRHTLRVVANAFLDEEDADTAYRRTRDRIAVWLERLGRARPPEPPTPLSRQGPPLDLRSNIAPEAYCAGVERAQDYIRAGDIYQVILSQRFAAPILALDPLAIYRTLRVVNPSPYMFLLNLDRLDRVGAPTGDGPSDRAGGGATLVGSSPERLVRLEEGRIDMRPLAGTRPRGATTGEDQAQAEALLGDPKERAEHVMLVDLTRNDVGRVSRYGSVRVTELLAIERYSHVMHLASHVEGALAPGRGPWDVLEAVFPHGTVSGAPKVRAMEIIDELEPVARGPYGGTVGYIGLDGTLNTAITIRTVLVRDQMAYVQAGAGVVYDSVPEREHQECLAKARGLWTAIERAGGRHAAGDR